MEAFNVKDYEQEVREILTELYPHHYDLVFTGVLTTLEKGHARMGQAKVKVTSYPREREHFLMLYVQPGDNGTCILVKLHVPSNFSATDVFEKIKARTSKPRKRKGEAAAEPVAGEPALTESVAVGFLREKYKRELEPILTELAQLEPRVTTLRTEKDRLEFNLAALEELQ
jgi:hypothetical protein